MGFMDEIRKLTHPYSEQEEEFDDYDDEPLEEEPVAAAAPRRSYSSKIPEMPRSSAGRVVNINPTNQLQVVLAKPERFDQVSEIADSLRNKQAVVLNLEATNKDVARRLVDFLSGCAYALDGKIKKVAISTYLITPYTVDVVGEVSEELDNAAMYF